MAKLIVKMNNEPVHDGQFIGRWENEETRKDRSKRNKPKAKPSEKKTKETTPRSTDENDQPRISTKLWIALRDRDNPNRQELQ